MAGRTWLGAQVFIHKFHNIVIRRSLSICHGKSKAHKFWPKCFERSLSHYTSYDKSTTQQPCSAQRTECWGVVGGCGQNKSWRGCPLGELNRGWPRPDRASRFQTPEIPRQFRHQRTRVRFPWGLPEQLEGGAGRAALWLGRKSASFRQKPKG